MRRHVVVHGRVQGVWFRGSTQAEALRQGVDGWVCNRRDGSVEVVFEGDHESVERMLAWCRSGPRFARVDAIDVEEDGAEAGQGPTWRGR